MAKRERKYNIIEAKCNHCWGDCRKTDGKEVYPHRADLWEKQFYVCDRCQARVGCHPNSDHPLGYAANAELRRARSHVHRILDPFWKRRKGSPKPTMKRGEVYSYLSDKMGLPKSETHVSMFRIEECREAYRHLIELGKVQS